MAFVTLECDPSKPTAQIVSALTGIKDVRKVYETAGRWDVTMTDSLEGNVFGKDGAEILKISRYLRDRPEEKTYFVMRKTDPDEGYPGYCRGFWSYNDIDIDDLHIEIVNKGEKILRSVHETSLNEATMTLINLDSALL